MLSYVSSRDLSIILHLPRVPRRFRASPRAIKQKLLRRASAACIEGQYHSGQRGNWNRTKPTLLPDTVAAAILAIAVDPPTMADRSEAMLELAWAHHVPSGALGHLS